MNAIITALLIPFLGTVLGASFVFYEARYARTVPKNLAGLRLGRNGGSIGVVTADTGNGDWVSF